MAVADDEWPQILQLLTEKVKKNDLIRQTVAPPAFEEKVGRALENLSVRNKVLTWISRCSETKYLKSGSTATRLRDQGNVKFGGRDNRGALKLYTESVICAPEYGPELSLAFGNRSAALFHLGHYSAASDDILLALNHKYPKNLEHKLHLRHAQCQIRLCQFTAALESLDKSQMSLEAARLEQDKKENILRDIAAIRKEASALRDSNPRPESESAERETPEFDNKTFPYASPKLSVKDSTDKVRGRYVIASSSVSQGEVIFSEVPYSSVLLPEHYSSHCHHCYVDLVAPISCGQCTQPRYCSYQCREEAWNRYHRWECGGLDLLHSVGIGHLALRTVLIAGKERLVKRQTIGQRQQEEEKEDLYLRVYNLQHHADKTCDEEMFQYIVTSALLATYLHKKTKFLAEGKGELVQLSLEDDREDRMVSLCGSFILRHVLQLICNAHAITELKEDPNGEVEQVRLATAIYPSASMMNHSCRPAIVNGFQGSRLLVRAVRDISSGDEVTNCYGPHYRRHKYAERQQMLLTQYRFQCRCECCVDPKEKNFLERFSAWKCQLCSGPVVGQTCASCKSTSSPNTEAEDKCRTKYSEAKSLASSGLLDQAVCRLRECLKEREAVLYRYNQELANTRDLLARCLADEANFTEAALHVRVALETIGERYGSFSIEYGNELLKYTDLLVASLTDEAAVGHGDDARRDLVRCLRQAAIIFDLNYGRKSKQYREVKEKSLHFESVG